VMRFECCKGQNLVLMYSCGSYFNHLYTHLWLIASFFLFLI
jgi:hypothetical protein